MNKAAIRIKVEELLEQFSINQAPIPVEDIARDLGLTIVEKEMEDSVSGALIPDKNTILVNSLHHPHRRRFTIAHEIAHNILHAKSKNLFVDSSFSFHRDEMSSSGSLAIEIDANRFAGELLMPKSILVDYLSKFDVDIFDSFSTANLAAKFNVSEKAITVRLQSLGLLSVF